jgi:hypothetical protein
MDQKEIFKFRVDTAGELIESNAFLTEKISIDHAKGLIKYSKSFPVTMKYLSPYEEEQSVKAIKDKKTNFKEDDVEYSISALGYRNSRPVEEIYNSVGVWGCSYTFGVGVPYADIYSNILESKLNTPVHNFGIPGAGIQKVTRSFIVNNNYFKFKTAFFVMPSLYRFEHLSFNNYSTKEEVPSDAISTFDLIPNWVPKHNKPLAKRTQILYELHDDAFFIMELSKNLELIKQSAELNGTKVYFATWCHKTHEFLLKYDISKAELVQFIESSEDMMHDSVQDFARDGMHPGIRSHQATANALYGLYYKGIRPSRSIENKQNLKLI